MAPLRSVSGIGLVIGVWVSLLVSQYGWSQDSDPEPQVELPSIRYVGGIEGYGKEQPFRDPTTLFVDRWSGSGEIVVADTGNDLVSIFDESWNEITRIGKSADLSAPIGVGFQADGTILVTEMESASLKVIDLKGQIIHTIDLTDFGPEEGDPVKAGRLTVDRDDRIYVLDRSNQRVLLFDARYKFVTAFGSKGDGEGQFRMAQDISISRTGECLVVSSRGRSVHVFSPTGKFIRSFGRHGTDKADFSFPVAAAMDPKGRVWVVDAFQHLLKVFNGTGFFLGARGQGGRGKGNFEYPSDIDFDRLGRLVILEKGSNRIQFFEVDKMTVKEEK